MLYPWAVILEAIRQPEDAENPDGTPKIGDKEAAVRLHLSERKIRVWRQDGMTWDEADLVCCRGVGRLPWVVYGEAWWDHVEADMAAESLDVAV